MDRVVSVRGKSFGVVHLNRGFFFASYGFVSKLLEMFCESHKLGMGGIERGQFGIARCIYFNYGAVKYYIFVLEIWEMSWKNPGYYYGSGK